MRSPRARRSSPGAQIEDIGGGLYLRPTVLTGVTHDMLIMQDETSGRASGDGLRRHRGSDPLANDTQFGLTASVIAGEPRKPRRSGGGSTPAGSSCRTPS
jgi:acyl-CoA reductase-like NAD-dependent aldehyde dehydrogenase